ncbi:MAG: 2-dehydropantoate 2-reductase N-terminal domain-containing protein [Polyangiaceae bacterium]
MKIVIVGAGAVGQVYGHHLAKGGAEVSVFVKPKHQREAERGFVLTRIPWMGPRVTEKFVPARVLTSSAELAAMPRVDQVWLCVPTPALDDALLHDVCVVGAPRASAVVLSPGYFVRKKVEDALGAARCVFGIIGMSSYHAPLEGSTDPRELETPAGLAYFLVPTMLSGVSERRALDAVSTLRAGGCPTKLVSDAASEQVMSSSTLMPIVASLEVAGWSMSTFRGDAELAALTANSMRESAAIASALVGRAVPWTTSLLGALTLRAAGFFAPRVSPFDIEAFLRVHFTKVGEQTRMLLGATLVEGRRLRLSTAALTELVERLDEARGADRAEP